MPSLSYLQIRNPKDDETSTESATQIFSSLLPSHIPLWKRIYITPKIYSFEIYYLSQMLYFYVTTPTEHETFVHSLISSAYPVSKMQKTTDPMDIMFKSQFLEAGELALTSYYYYPIKTYADFKIDPLAPLIGFLTKQDAQVKMMFQMLVTPASFPWQAQALGATTKTVTDAMGVSKTTASDANKSLIAKKAMFQGGRTVMRLLVGTSNAAIPIQSYLQNLAGTFGSFNFAEGNQFKFKKPLFRKDLLLNKIKERKITYFERKSQILNAQELATLWHPPGKALEGIRNIAWGKTLKGEPPENLPVADPTTTDDEKKDVNFFAKTDYKNREQIFGISTRDRGKHIYVMGKTGAGKSTLIANMAIDDIRKDRGIGIIDPHGDLCETVLDYIPKRRLNDVVYLEPFDTERPFSLNVLEIHENQHKHLIASGIVSIFSKLYANSWGPRLEYVLRNVVLTLLEIPGATLADVLPLLAHEGYRAKIIPRIQDQVIRDFWIKEFNEMPPKMKAEVVSPIQNKVGQFVSTKMIRNIIGYPQSSVKLDEIMDGKKILLLNLSQGKLGEDNAALLGAMIITQIQLAAMRRAFLKEEDRVPFFLYVDEFQNFATSSFLKILSEARKYRLSLTLANQYIDQLEEDIQRAIFGNVGTLMTFFVGARDAEVLSKEFAGLYTNNDLVSLGKHEIIIKLSIDFATSFPFPAKTLPLPSLKNSNREKIVRLSKEKYGRKVKEQELFVQDPSLADGGDKPALPPPQSGQSEQRAAPKLPAPQKKIDAKPKEVVHKEAPKQSSDSNFTPIPQAAPAKAVQAKPETQPQATKLNGQIFQHPPQEKKSPAPQQPPKPHSTGSPGGKPPQKQGYGNKSYGNKQGRPGQNRQGGNRPPRPNQGQSKGPPPAAKS